MRVIRYSLAIVFVQLVLGGPALAQRAYTLVFPDGGPLASLLRFDPASGQSLVIGPLGAAAQALTFDGGGVLYAADRAAGLMRVDPGTGAATPIGPFGVTVARVRGLAFDGATYARLAGLALGTAPGALDIPVLSAHGMAVLIVLIALGGLLIRRGGLR